jgi:hypothetical protein
MFVAENQTMASRISAIVFFVLSANLSVAAAVDYVATAGNVSSSEIASYQSVSSGLVTVYTPVIVTHNPGSQCVQPEVAYRPVMPPASSESAAACPRPDFGYRLMVSPPGFPGFIAPTPSVPSIEMEFPAGVK